jgi:putative inorganic carbon (hco3(-)) transporter
VAFFLFGLVLFLTYLRPVEVFIPALAEARIGMIVALIAFFVGALSRAGAKGKVLEKQHYVLLLIFIVAIFASQATRGWLSGAISAVSTFAFSAVIFILACMNISSFKRLRSTMGILVICSVTLAGLSIVSYHTGLMSELLLLRQGTSLAEAAGTSALAITSPNEDVNKVWLWRIKSFGFLSDPNDFAQFLLLGALFIFSLQKPNQKVRLLFVTLPICALLIYAVLLTQSRGAITGLGAIIFVMSYFRFGLGKTLLAMLPVIALILSRSIVNGGREFSASEESAGGRIAAWSEGLVMLMNRPIFGVGFDSFTDHHTYTAHNTFVLCFSELGLVGYFAWLGLLVFVLLGIRDGLLRLPVNAGFSESKQYLRMITIAMAGFLACAFFLSRTYSPTLYVLLAMGISIERLARLEFSENVKARKTSTINGTFFKQKNWIPITFGALFASLIGFYFITIIYWRFFGRN